MAYTLTQVLRKIRGGNKGANVKLARTLRTVAERIGAHGPEELTKPEIKLLQGIRNMVTTRLYLNAMAKGFATYAATRPAETYSKAKLESLRRDSEKWSNKAIAKTFKLDPADL